MRLAFNGFVCSLEGHLQTLGLQCREVRGQRLESFVGDGHQHDPGELARQP